jgi:hypothetical protein
MSLPFKLLVVNVLFLFVITIKTNAQSKLEGYEFGVNVGSLVYQGDLSNAIYGYVKEIRPAIGLFAARPLGQYFNLRLGVTHGRILANDSKYNEPAFKQQRNFKFSSPVTELATTVAFNPLGFNSETSFRRLTPYVFAGVGASFLNIKRDYSNIDPIAYSPRSPAMLGLGFDTLQTLPKVLAVFPIGGGLKLALNSNWYLNGELSYRFTASDYIDGFSYAADPKQNDSYYGLSLGVSYKIMGNRYRCPPMRQ